MTYAGEHAQRMRGEIIAYLRERLGDVTRALAGSPHIAHDTARSLQAEVDLLTEWIAWLKGSA